MARAKKSPSSPDLLLTELKGLRKDLVVFCHMLLRQQKLDRYVTQRMTQFKTGKGDKSKVSANVLFPNWPDALHDLDAVQENSE